jgi:hypothetical protein
MNGTVPRSLRRPHPFIPDPVVLADEAEPPCVTCGYGLRCRLHQPLWWRSLHPYRLWR